MINYLLTSTFIHAGLLLGLCFSPEVNTPVERGSIEVNIRHSSKYGDQAPILSKSSTVRKPLIPRESGAKAKKVQKVDLTNYANRLKAVIDPVWYGHVHGLEPHLLKKYTTIILLFPDKHGNIVSMKVVKGSGDEMLDTLAIQTFREVGHIPIPPESLVKEGIEWEFVIGGGR